MSIYGQYLKERENIDMYEVPGEGFATYELIGDTCYIIDIFVVKSQRKKGAASKMADEIVKIVKKNGCTGLMGSVDVSTANPTDSMKVLLAYGMKVLGVEGKKIFFHKDI